MTAEELRVGNLVKAGYAIKGIGTIESILSSTFRCFVHSVSKEFLSETLLRDIEPIPLTEEWLLKFGFGSKYKSVHMHWNLGPFGIDQKSDEDDHGGSIPQENIWYYENAGWAKEIIHVHQLQNLYFALTGKELEYDGNK